LNTTKWLETAVSSHSVFWQGQKDLKKIRDFQLKTIIEKHRKNGD
jgi:hypothetical protein